MQECLKIDPDFEGAGDWLNDFENLRSEIWDRLGVEERKSYKSAKPDILQGKSDALNTFNSPEVTETPDNFSVLVVYPQKGEF
jgi:hypothetical protein